MLSAGWFVLSRKSAFWKRCFGDKMEPCWEGFDIGRGILGWTLLVYWKPEELASSLYPPIIWIVCSIVYWCTISHPEVCWAFSWVFPSVYLKGCSTLFLLNYISSAALKNAQQLCNFPFFCSMAGCPFGENCHFLHFFPGGYKAVSQVMNLAPPPALNISKGPLPIQNGSSPTTVKTKLCNKFLSGEGCKYNDKCHFAHGEKELGRPISISHSQEDSRATIGAIPSHFGARPEPPIQGLAASFGASATAKISVAASLAGAIIGKGGVNSKQICRQTGAKLSIRDHETDPELKNIELEGTFEQIKEASAMVREFIGSIAAGGVAGKVFGGGGGGPPAPGSNFKTKLCENFSKGSCSFGDRCHFAHGAAELRKTGVWVVYILHFLLVLLFIELQYQFLWCYIWALSIFKFGQFTF